MDSKAELRSRMFGLLLDSCGNGNLQQALEDLELSQAALKIQAVHRGKAARQEMEGAKKAKRGLAEVQWRARGLLLTALDNGTLAQIIKQDEVAVQPMLDFSSAPSTMSMAVEAPTSPRALDLAVEDLRVQMCDALARSCQAGELGSILESVHDTKAKPKSSTVSDRGEIQDLEEIRQKMQSALETACSTGALTKALQNIAPPTDLEAVRAQMRDVLDAACRSGHLGLALEGIRAEDAKAKAREAQDNMEDVRLKMQQALESACDTGALGKALQAGKSARAEDMKAKARDGQDDLEDIRFKMQQALESACDTGALGRALQASKPVGQVPSAMAIVPVPPPVPSTSSGAFIRRNLMEDFTAAGRLDTRATDSGLKQGAATRLLQSISLCNRRAGALTLLIKEAEKRLAEQDECCMRLESEIVAARRDAEHLGLDLEQNMAVLEKQETANRRLHESQRRLMDDLEDEALMQKHRTLELDANLYSARSDLSTACTVRDLASPVMFASSRGAACKGLGFSLTSNEAHQGRPGAITAPPMTNYS